MCYPKYFEYTPHSSAKHNVVYFYICLSVHIMYTIHNKATFMVTEIINPKIRKSNNSTISDHLLALDKTSRFRGNTHICLHLNSILDNTIQHFSNNNKRTNKNFTNFYLTYYIHFKNLVIQCFKKSFKLTLSQALTYLQSLL